MNIVISNSNGKPIYEQITNQIKAMIMDGTLKADDALPSIRLLAKELRISVITTKRAYEELEQEGFIVTQPGKGSFVAQSNQELMKEEQLRRIEASLQEAVDCAKVASIEEEYLQDMLATLYRE